MSRIWQAEPRGSPQRIRPTLPGMAELATCHAVSGSWACPEPGLGSDTIDLPEFALLYQELANIRDTLPALQGPDSWHRSFGRSETADLAALRRPLSRRLEEIGDQPLELSLPNRPELREHDVALGADHDGER